MSNLESGEFLFPNVPQGPLLIHAAGTHLISAPKLGPGDDRVGSRAYPINIFNQPHFKPLVISPCSSSPASQIKPVGRTWHPMFLHLGCNWVALVMIRHRLSPRAKQPKFNTPAMVKYRLIQAGTSQFPQTAFSFKPALPGHPFIADRLRAALFVTSSASLQLLGLEITALHRNSSPINFCIHSRYLRLYVVTNGYARDNGRSITRPPAGRCPNQAC